MKISIIPVSGTRTEFDLSDVGAVYADDDVIYFDGVPCILSSAQPPHAPDRATAPDVAQADESHGA